MSQASPQASPQASHAPHALKAPLSPVASAARELGLTALVATALVFPLVALRVVDSVQGLYIEPRWPASIAAVLLVVLGRLGIIMLRHNKPAPVLAGGLLAAALSLFVPLPAELLVWVLRIGGLVLALRASLLLFTQLRGTTTAQLAARREHSTLLVRRLIPYAAAGAVLFALIMPWLPFSSRYLVDVGVLILTYVLLGWGLNIIVGYAGLLDLGYVAFYAVGAYSYALLAVNFGWSFWICLPLAGLLASCFGILLGFPVLRLRGDYFAIVTLGFGEIVRLVLINWFSFTGGPDGIASVPRPSFFGIAEFNKRVTGDLPLFHEKFGLEFSSEHRLIFLYYLVMVLAALVAVFTIRIRNLPLGRAWEALREDDIASASLGLDRRRIKLAAFAISAMWGGFAGAFFATRQGFISPESFTFIESAIVLSIVVLGGMGNLVGIALAAVVLIGAPEIFRELSSYRMVAFGGGLVIIMVWRPRGLISFRDPSVRLFDRLGRLRRDIPGYARGEVLRTASEKPDSPPDTSSSASPAANAGAPAI